MCLLINNTWYKYVEIAEYIINNNFNETIGYIPEEVMKGRKLSHEVFKHIRFPKQKFELDSEDVIKNNINKNILNKNNCKFKNIRPHKKFLVGDKVLIRNFVLSNKFKKVSAKLCPKWKDPFIVEKIVGKGCYIIRDSRKMGKKVQVNERIF